MTDNIKEIKKMHRQLAEYYYTQTNDFKYDYMEIALQNFLLSKLKDFDEPIDKISCDLMLELSYFAKLDKIGIIKRHFQEYIKNCKLYNIDYDFKYFIYFVLISIIVEAEYTYIDDLLKIDNRIKEYELNQLMDALSEKNIEVFTNYVQKYFIKINDKYIFNMLTLLKNYIISKSN